ncbi:hypothetical protein P262_p1030 (plasmid) [Cronobacter malonaticus]|uniref:Uncharacterized protein n=1 Tax=Cronobacter malonaticus TaxID=413503 RepID=V5U6T7_9ENTR|nr:hypothetical protein P262_p1030 [Cronobacter malonaticus]CCJ95375.1 hypothetical protein BN131_3048 [Cronobacter malonaticus 681]
MEESFFMEGSFNLMHASDFLNILFFYDLNITNVYYKQS